MLRRRSTHCATTAQAAKSLWRGVTDSFEATQINSICVEKKCCEISQEATFATSESFASRSITLYQSVRNWGQGCALEKVGFFSFNVGRISFRPSRSTKNDGAFVINSSGFSRSPETGPEQL